MSSLTKAIGFSLALGASGAVAENNSTNVDPADVRDMISDECLPHWQKIVDTTKSLAATEGNLNFNRRGVLNSIGEPKCVQELEYETGKTIVKLLITKESKVYFFWKDQEGPIIGSPDGSET